MADQFDREDVEAVADCLGDDAAQLRQENDEDERAANMDRAASILTWMLLTHPAYASGVWTCSRGCPAPEVCKAIHSAGGKCGGASGTASPAPSVEAEFELHAEDGVCLAGASGPRAEAWAEIQRYAAQYKQDGPVVIYEVTRTPVPSGVPVGNCTDEAQPRKCWAVEMGWERTPCETPCAMKRCNPAGVQAVDPAHLLRELVRLDRALTKARTTKEHEQLQIEHLAAWKAAVAFADGVKGLSDGR